MSKSVLTLLYALFPFADPNRLAWRDDMTRRYESSRRQNRSTSPS